MEYYSPQALNILIPPNEVTPNEVSPLEVAPYRVSPVGVENFDGEIIQPTNLNNLFADVAD